MASEGFQQSSSHWYVTDLNLSLQFHYHGLVIIATTVVFIVLFISFILCNFLNHCNQIIISNPPSSSSSGEVLQNGNKGLDEAAINSLPIFLHQNTTTTTTEDHHQCCICLCSFEENEMVKVIPICMHFYHSQCVDEWLQSRAICPLCRAPLSPSSTSLQIEIQPSSSPSTSHIYP